MNEDSTQETEETTAVDTPTEEVTETKPAEDKTDAKPDDEAKAEPTEADKALAKAEKKTAKLSYENRRMTRQLKSNADKTAKDIAELKQMIQKNAPQAQEPDIADFEKIGDYHKAMHKYLSNQEAQASSDDSGQDDQDNAEYQQYFNDSRTEMIETGNEKYDDFELVITDDATKLSLPMCEALFDMESDVQADVAYFLGKNHKETLRIAKLRPQRQFAELGKLEAKFASKPAKKRTSNAPDPIEPVGGSSTPNDTIRDGMSPEEFQKVWNKKWRR